MSRKIAPQPGPQTMLLQNPADIIIYGGSAGGGKSYGLLMSPLRHKNTPGFGCTIFRKNFNQIFSQGGLWDESTQIYQGVRGARPKYARGEWWFLNEKEQIVSAVKFAHIERDEDVSKWQGSQICEIGFDELTHFCLPPDTEVLTESGWKKITDVSVGEFVPSRSLSGKIEMKRVLDTPSFDYDGDMIDVYQRNGIAALMTPNHKVPVESQADGSNKVVHRFVRADHLLRRRVNVARAGSWESVYEEELYRLKPVAGRGIGRNANSADSLPMDDWLELLGWYLSEGSSFLASKSRGGTSPCVSIRQTKENESLRRLMDRLPWKVRPDGDGGYKIYSRQLYEELHPLGNLYEKRIPRYVFALSKRQQRILFNAFMQGDGYFTDTRAYQVGLANEGLIDDLQEMAVYLGRIATKSVIVTKTGFMVYSLNIRAEKHRQFSIVKPNSVKRTPYSGKVYCLTVEDNHTFLIRYKNRISWTGNSEKTFFYMLSRNRSTCGVKPHVIGTCNPDADSWVAKFIEWWIDQVTGYPIPERSGKIRYFIRRDEVLHWANTREELWEKFDLRTEEEKQEPKSVTFIMSSVYDNKALLKVNPGYLANLKSLSVVERERLLHGNWHIKAAAGLFFKREQVGDFLDKVPADVVRWVRCWDLAATEKDENGDAAFTAGVLMGKRKNGRYVIADVINRQMSAANVRQTIKLTAQQDRAKYKRVRIRLPKDPGQAGKEQAETYIKFLAGFDVTAVPESGSKEARAEPMAAQWQAGNFDIVIGDWNEPFLLQLENFPDSKFKDMVDAAANGFSELELISSFNVANLT